MSFLTLSRHLHLEKSLSMENFEHFDDKERRRNCREIAPDTIFYRRRHRDVMLKERLTYPYSFSSSNANASFEDTMGSEVNQGKEMRSREVLRKRLVSELAVKAIWLSVCISSWEGPSAFCVWKSSDTSIGTSLFGVDCMVERSRITRKNNFNFLYKFLLRVGRWLINNRYYVIYKWFINTK